MDRETDRKLEALVALYGSTQLELEAALLNFPIEDLRALITECEEIVDRLDRKSQVIIRDVVHRIVLYETRLAERRLNASPLVVSKEMMSSIDRRFYATFAQQHAEIRRNVVESIERGWSRGMSLEDKRAIQKNVIQQGIVGLARADGSKLSVRATGKAMVRTRVNQLQAEVQKDRYRQAKVEKVIFVAGGPCKYEGEGGTCTGLDGEQFPIDDIPEWAEIPRHLYSNSRWLPVIP